MEGRASGSQPCRSAWSQFRGFSKSDVLEPVPPLARLVGTTIALSADPVVAETRHRFWNDRCERTSQVIDRAVERGELSEGANPREVIETLSVTMYFRLLVGDEVRRGLHRPLHR
ncbi:TetR-like C-terminal domain-containing protein [Nocardia sp. NPDC051463]|uniref:TetR-like C-terminal domain-containing protein n=1 Tax=Nocardia sp. NPDC051463 TaxID=3154845 RepID=UPI00344FEAE8